MGQVRGSGFLRRTAPGVKAYSAYFAPLMYATAFALRFFHVMKRSAFSAIKFICHSDCMLVLAVGGESGAVSICNDASRDASIDTPPSSASMISDAFARMIGKPSTGEPVVDGRFSDATTGSP